MHGYDQMHQMYKTYVPLYPHSCLTAKGEDIVRWLHNNSHAYEFNIAGFRIKSHHDEPVKDT